MAKGGVVPMKWVGQAGLLHHCANVQFIVPTASEHTANVVKVHVYFMFGNLCSSNGLFCTHNSVCIDMCVGSVRLVPTALHWLYVRR